VSGVTVWYRVRDLDAGRRFYAERLGFIEVDVNPDERWTELVRGTTRIGLAEGEPEDGAVATVDVEDVKAEAAHLREMEADVGVVLELHGEMRLLDVHDPDGNRIQLAEELSRG